MSDGLRKDRHGVWIGLKDRKLTGAVDLARRVEGVEGGNNTVAVPRTVRSRTSGLMSAFALVRPLEWAKQDRQSRLGVVARLDAFKIDNPTSASNRFTVFGAFWDLTPKTTLTVDLQQLEPNSSSTTVATKTLFVHWKADF